MTTKIVSQSDPKLNNPGANPKAATIARIRANVPAELRDLAQWVTWRMEKRDGKQTKVPYDAKTGAKAEADDPTTWASFDTASTAYLHGKYVGIGFEFSEHDPYTGIDLDKCINAGVVDPYRLAIVRQMASYTERSQSGTGVHIIVCGRLPIPDDKTGRKDPQTGIEMYHKGRFFVMTGDRLEDTPAAISERQAELVEVFNTIFPAKAPKTNTKTSTAGAVDVDDQKLLELMFAAKNGASVKALWDGSTIYRKPDGERDDSSHDQAMCNHLAFWTNGDAARIDRLFRQSGLYRDKWERADYRTMTINKAIGDMGEGYRPGARRNQNGTAAAGAAPEVEQVVELPVILLNNRQLSDLMTETMAAIVEHGRRTDPMLFVRSGRLVRLAADENGSLRTDLVTPDALLGIMAHAARWMHATQTKDGGERLTSVSPPAIVARVLCASSGWDLPVLEGIAHAPIFGADGSLHTSQGYNPVTRLYHAGTVNLGDTTPTPGNLAAAVGLLTGDLFVDFPLDAPSLAHAIALAILPFVRPMVKGATPLHLATAPQHRAGKSLLVESALYAALGRTPDMTADAGDEAEWAKVLTSKLLSSPSCVVLDNLGAELRSPMLATAISEARLTSRILGSNTEVSAPARWVWAATARNPTLHEELMLRSVLIRLAPDTEQPEARTGFKHPNQLEWVAANRDRIVTAIVTIVRNWVEKANRKPYAGRAKGRFESWVGVLGGILEAAGIGGFLDNEAELRSSASPEADAFRAFVLAWYAKHGSSPVTAKELFMLASTPDDDKLTPGADLLGEVLGGKSQQGRAVALGIMIRAYSGRVYTNPPRSFRISMLTDTTRAKVKQWFLEEITAGGCEKDTNPRAAPPHMTTPDRGGLRGVVQSNVDPVVVAGNDDVSRQNGGVPQPPATPATPAGLAQYADHMLSEAELQEAIGIANELGAAFHATPVDGGWRFAVKTA